MEGGYAIIYYNDLKTLLKKEEYDLNYYKNVVICSQEITLNINGKEVPSRRYFWIKAIDLQRFLYKRKVENRNFHEVCRNEHPQKFFLDIDYEYKIVKHAEKFDANTFLKPYVKLIREFFLYSKENGMEMKDDMKGIIFQSVSKNKKKISFHIIISGVYFRDILYHKVFAEYIEKNFNDVRKRVNPKLTGKVYTECHIDSKIYKRLFSLRLPGCTKKGGDEARTKKFYAWFNIFDDFLRYKPYKGIFLDSLLTYIDNCVKFKVSTSSELGKRILQLKQEKQKKESGEFLGEVDVPDNIMEIYEEFARENNMDVMKIRETNSRKGVTFISLLRNNPSYCIICKRKHHSENAYLLITQKSILYSCYRTDERYYISKNFEGVQEFVKEGEDEDDEPDKIMAEIEKRMKIFRGKK